MIKLELDDVDVLLPVASAKLLKRFANDDDNELQVLLNECRPPKKTRKNASEDDIKLSMLKKLVNEARTYGWKWNKIEDDVEHGIYR